MTLHQRTQSQQIELVEELETVLNEAISMMASAEKSVSRPELRSLLAQGVTDQRDALRRLRRVSGPSSRKTTEAENPRVSGDSDDATILQEVARQQARVAMTYAKAEKRDHLPATLRAICMRGQGETRRHVEALVTATVDLRNGVTHDEPSFTDKITDLERFATTPPVVGETRTWCGRLREELDRIAERYDLQRRRHTKLRRDMAQRDPQLSHRRKELARREGVVAQQLRRLLRDAKQLTDVDTRGQNEPFNEARRLRVRVLAWCVAARALEGEIQSSYLEAHYRDRGTVD
jgi:hypothetical protein